MPYPIQLLYMHSMQKEGVSPGFVSYVLGIRLELGCGLSDVKHCLSSGLVIADNLIVVGTDEFTQLMQFSQGHARSFQPCVRVCGSAGFSQQDTVG